ncbi:MAG TPA: IclR family transcriptional regulator [Bryobacteraceae bacterium]|nr:IclR family transcriptional regulator [Bryobacteraceae bacterium]
MKKAAPDTPSIQSLDRGLTILEAISGAKHPVSLAQLREVLGIDRSSVFRLANTLRRRGFLANPNGRNDQYVTGRAVWNLSRNHDWSMLVRVCHHHMTTLASETGETAHLGVRAGSQILFIDHQTAANQTIAVSGQTGEFKPLYCTAHGKALLTDCGLAELKAMFGSEPLQAYTLRTIISVEQLAQDLAKAKALGFTVDDAEFQEEVRCLAAPIRDQNGVIIAAIGISAPATRLSRERLLSTGQKLAAAAKEITGLLYA